MYTTVYIPVYTTVYTTVYIPMIQCFSFSSVLLTNELLIYYNDGNYITTMKTTFDFNFDLYQTV